MRKKVFSLSALAALFFAAPAYSGPGHDHSAHEQGQKAGQVGQTITVKGEVIDMVCYIDHNATGEKHAECAKTCIESGLPVGIKSADGKLYLLVGEHKPLNRTLAPLAAKTITVKGKLASRDGYSMIENAEIVK